MPSACANPRPNLLPHQTKLSFARHRSCLEFAAAPCPGHAEHARVPSAAQRQRSARGFALTLPPSSPSPPRAFASLCCHSTPSQPRRRGLAVRTRIAPHHPSHMHAQAPWIRTGSSLHCTGSNRDRRLGPACQWAELPLTSEPGLLANMSEKERKEPSGLGQIQPKVPKPEPRPFGLNRDSPTLLSARLTLRAQ
jgi:hypothetical protein